MVKKSLRDAHFDYLVEHEMLKMIKMTSEDFIKLKKELEFIKMMEEYFDSQYTDFKHS